MAKRYKLYIFDLDGTLLDSDELLRVTFRTLYELHKPKDYKIDDSRILTFSGPQITETLSKEFPEQDLNFMLEEWKKYSNENYVKYSHLYPGAEDLLRLMSKKDVNYCIVTNKHRQGTDYSLNVLNIDDLNIFCVCADEVKHLKPQPDGIFIAMKHFGITKKSDIVYIGDSIYDYLTAKNAGVDFGFVTWSPRKLEKDCKIDFKIENYATFAEDFKWKRQV